MSRPKSEAGPKRKQPYMWSVNWGPELDEIITARVEEETAAGRDTSKNDAARYLCRQGYRYLEAAKTDPAIAARVEEIYAATLSKMEAEKSIPEVKSERDEVVRSGKSTARSASKAEKAK